MKTFVDSAGRTWPIDLNVGSLTRLRDLADVNLWETLAGGAEKLLELVADPFALASVLHALARPEIAARQLPDQEFFAALDGETLYRAGQSLLQEAIDFFQKSRGTSGMTEMLEALLAKESQLTQSLVRRAQAELASIDPETEAARLFTSLVNDSKRSAGNSAAS